MNVRSNTSCKPVSKTEQGYALLRQLLADGPVKASSIMAAAEGAKIARRTLQLAASKLGVVRSKVNYGKGWTWALPDPARKNPTSAEIQHPKIPVRVGDGQEGVQLFQGEDDKVLLRDVKVQPRKQPEPAKTRFVVERAKFIATMLNKREERRTRERGRFHWQDARVQGWAAAGVRDYHLKEAYDLAASADEFRGAVTVGLLGRYLQTVMADEGAIP